jgi:hypothetical protein
MTQYDARVALASAGRTALLPLGGTASWETGQHTSSQLRGTQTRVIPQRNQPYQLKTRMGQQLACRTRRPLGRSPLES